MVFLNFEATKLTETKLTKINEEIFEIRASRILCKQNLPKMPKISTQKLKLGVENKKFHI